jgi:hypothetical protein
MIDDLDDALRDLLIREMPIKGNEIDISFGQPNKEWSSRLSRPTLNLYLHDIRENPTLRRDQNFAELERRPDSVVHRRPPLRIALHYLVTAWATAPEDEHRMLARALLALLRYQELPDDVLPEGLQDQPSPIPLKVAQADMLEKPSDIWSVLDNQQRPGITFTATLAFNPFAPVVKPVTRTAEFKFGQSEDMAGTDHGYIMVSGKVLSKKPLNNLQVLLLEQGVQADIHPDGQFGIRNLRPGNYTLEVRADGLKPKKHKIKVPAPSYDVDL